MKKYILLLLAITIIACKPQQTIVISGSSTVLPIIAQAAQQYKQTNPKINIIINGGGSGVGLQQLTTGVSDIAMMSRDITKEEEKRFQDKTLTKHTIGKDAVAIAVSSEIYDAGITTITQTQLKKIYLGSINNWQQLGGPDKDILLIDKETNRGTRHVVMQKLFGNPYIKTPGTDLVLGSNNEEQTAIAESDSAIGLLSYAWLNEQVKGLTLKTLGTEFIPTEEKYPFTRNLNIVTTQQENPQIQQFINYLKSEQGQKWVTAAGYVALK